MKGKIQTMKEGYSGAYAFTIKGEDGNEYISHLGDLKENENILYNLRDQKYHDIGQIYKDFNSLEIGQEVEFDPWKTDIKHAIHVTKAS